MAYTELSLTKSLFHYTSIDAFKVIATTGEMRFSRADQTNDPFEVILIRNAVIEFLNYLIENEKKTSEIRFLRAILSVFERVCQPSKFYLSCWSRNSLSLPMWRLYAGEGAGICFGLRPRAFDAFDCRLHEVDYVNEDIAILDHLRKYVGKSHDEISMIKDDVEHIPFAVRLLEATLSTKLFQWKYEEEVRLSFSLNEERYKSIEEHVDPVLFERLSEYDPTTIDKVSDRQFLFQSFGKRENQSIDRSRAISYLILGSNCEWNEDDAMKFLADLGYSNVDVTRSTVQWR